MTEQGWRHRTVEAGLTAGALAGSLCLLWALASLALGLTPLVLVSGSMSPAIEVGDLAVARAVPARDLAVGDVVSVETSAGVRVTHRVVGTTPEGASTALVLQGDANASPDATPYVVTTADRVLFHVPYAGRVIAAGSSRVGVVVLGVLVGGLLLLGFAPRRSGGQPSGGRARHRDGGRRSVTTGVVGVVAVGAVSVGGLVAPPTPTTAYLTDTGAVSSGTLGSSSMVAPTITCSGGWLAVLAHDQLDGAADAEPGPVRGDVLPARQHADDHHDRLHLSAPASVGSTCSRPTRSP